VIIPDMSLENDEGLNKFCKKYDIANIFVAAPGVEAKRIKLLSDAGDGILYTVVRRGITGKETLIDKTVLNWLNLVKQNSSLPIAAGFGINSNKQIKKLEGIADIAVVGSFFVRKINEAIEKKFEIKDFLKNETQKLLN